MLSDSITLNDGSADVAYSRHRTYNLKSVFVTPDHNTSEKDTLTFLVTEPKATKDFNGVRRATARLTRVRSVSIPGGGTTLAPENIDINFSIPEGTVEADSDALCALAASLLGNAAVMAQLRHQLAN